MFRSGAPLDTGVTVSVPYQLMVPTGTEDRSPDG